MAVWLGWPNGSDERLAWMWAPSSSVLQQASFTFYTKDSRYNTAENLLNFLTSEFSLEILKFLKILTHSEDELVVILASDCLDSIDSIMKNRPSVSKIEKKIQVFS